MPSVTYKPMTQHLYTVALPLCRIKAEIVQMSYKKRPGATGPESGAKSAITRRAEAAGGKGPGNGGGTVNISRAGERDGV